MREEWRCVGSPIPFKMGECMFETAVRTSQVVIVFKQVLESFPIYDNLIQRKKRYQASVQAKCLRTRPASNASRTTATPKSSRHLQTSDQLPPATNNSHTAYSQLFFNSHFLLGCSDSQTHFHFNTLIRLNLGTLHHKKSFLPQPKS